ncbi:MAG: hypothetical protein ACK2UJ_12205 [Candidatus Promineifilaceae bacterium]
MTENGRAGQWMWPFSKQWLINQTAAATGVPESRKSSEMYLKACRTVLKYLFFSPQI